MYNTILVPTDGSETSSRALPVASSIARRCGARVHVLAVMDPSTFIPFVPGEVAVPVYDSSVVTEQRKRSEQEMQRIVASLIESGIEASGTVLDGTVVETIAEHAIEIGADITVMTTHGRSGFNRLRLGSVASAYVTRTSTPTLLVRILEDGRTPEVPIDGTLLCPLDGSEFAESILPHAVAFASSAQLGMELMSVTIPAAIPMAPFGTEALIADPQDLQAQEENREHYLERVAAASCPPGTATRVVTDMAVGSAIIEVAKSLQPAAIAIATHGRSGLMRLMLGSVADEVLRGADVPILAYKPNPKQSA